jgi:hypothetical protein
MLWDGTESASMILRMQPAGSLLTLAIWLSGIAPAAAVFTVEWVGFGPSGKEVPAIARPALERAAAAWSSVFNDDVTIRLTAEWQPLTASPGSAAVTITSQDFLAFTDVIPAMVSDAAKDRDDGIVKHLKHMSQTAFTLPAGSTLATDASGTTRMAVARAVQKALGLSNSPFFDAGIGFNSHIVVNNQTIPFDYDRSNGVTPGTVDLETVAMHEIGHALGFLSVVSTTPPAQITPTPLDLFRFGPAEDPETPNEFKTFNRNLVAGVDSFFDDTTNEYLFSTGTDGANPSHWKEDGGIPTMTIGVLDPIIETGRLINISVADIRALDLIGYDLDIAGGTGVPEAGQVLTLGTVVVVLGLFVWRRQTSCSSSELAS